MKSRGLRKIPTCSYGAIWSVGFCSAPALRQSNTFTPIKSRNLSNQRGTMQIDGSQRFLEHIGISQLLEIPPQIP